MSVSLQGRDLGFWEQQLKQDMRLKAELKRMPYAQAQLDKCKDACTLTTQINMHSHTPPCTNMHSECFHTHSHNYILSTHLHPHAHICRHIDNEHRWNSHVYLNSTYTCMPALHMHAYIMQSYCPNMHIPCAQTHIQIGIHTSYM